MRLVVTRPQPEAGRWARELRARGIDAVELPLIAIAPAPDAQAVTHAWTRLPQCRAAMFVSRHAVDGFFVERPRGGWPPAVRAWAPGPGTREALLEQGLAAAQVDTPAPDAAQLDSESLWQAVRGQVVAGDTVLIVRGAGSVGGGNGREWLAAQLTQAGAQVEVVQAYQRVLPAWSPAEQDSARAALADGSLWLFSSSEAIANLRQLLPGQELGAAHAITTHPRIAEAARASGFCDVGEAQPSLNAIVASIESAR